MSRKQADEFDHEVDGIRELDNDLPRWWLYGFYVTIVIAVVYFANYHVLSTPLVGSKTVAAEYEADVTAHPKPAATSARAGGTVPASLTLLTGPQDLEAGKKIFESSTHPCHACHRADLGGLVGPNLTDDKWLHGCSVGQVVESIRTGYPLQGMVPFGGGPALGDQQLLELASYILSRRDSHPANPRPVDPVRDLACPSPGH